MWITEVNSFIQFLKQGGLDDFHSLRISFFARTVPISRADCICGGSPRDSTEHPSRAKSLSGGSVMWYTSEKKEKIFDQKCKIKGQSQYICSNVPFFT